MAKNLSIIMLLLFSLSSFSQEEEKKPVRIYGRIVDSYHLPVSFAHIINKHRNIGTISDYYGVFNIGSYPGDTLAVSAVGYHALNFIVPDTVSETKFSLELKLEQDTVMLEEQVIYPWPETYDELKKEILEARPEVELAEGLLVPWFKRGELTNEAYPNGGIRMTGPIGLLYSRFSKEARIRKALEQIGIHERVRKRYNSELVSRITGLTDLIEINKLMEYCDLSIDFIFSSSDYELYVAIYACYKDFVQAQNN